MRKFHFILSLLTITFFLAVADALQGQETAWMSSKRLDTIRKNSWHTMSLFDYSGAWSHQTAITGYDLLSFSRGILNGRVGLGTTLFSVQGYSSDRFDFAHYYLLPVELVIPLYNHWLEKGNGAVYSDFGLQIKLWHSSIRQIALSPEPEKTGLINHEPVRFSNDYFREARISLQVYYYFLNFEAGYAIDYNKVTDYQIGNHAFLKISAGIPGNVKFHGRKAEARKKTGKTDIQHSEAPTDLIYTAQKLSVADKANHKDQDIVPEINGGAVNNNSTSARISSDFSSPIKKGEYRISSGYGYRYHPITRKYEFHHGTDFSCPVGTIICSIEAGVILESGFSGSYGHYVVIDHDGSGYVSKYAHLQSFTVTQGAHVRKGDTIGYSGNSGLSTGPHLHLEVWVNGKAVNPLSVIGQ